MPARESVATKIIEGVKLAPIRAFAKKAEAERTTVENLITRGLEEDLSVEEFRRRVVQELRFAYSSNLVFMGKKNDDEAIERDADMIVASYIDRKRIARELSDAHTEDERIEINDKLTRIRELEKKMDVITGAYEGYIRKLHTLGTEITNALSVPDTGDFNFTPSVFDVINAKTKEFLDTDKDLSWFLLKGFRKGEHSYYTLSEEYETLTGRTYGVSPQTRYHKFILEMFVKIQVQIEALKQTITAREEELIEKGSNHHELDEAYNNLRDLYIRLHSTAVSLRSSSRLPEELRSRILEGDALEAEVEAMLGRAHIGERPVIEPTVVPTVEPTVVPSTEPTVVPSVEPTVVPTPTTSEPTVAPTPTTEAPTVAPTIVPSTEPTVVPSIEPTVAPTPTTEVPTVEPTVEPTMEPTEERVSWYKRILNKVGIGRTREESETRSRRRRRERPEEDAPTLSREEQEAIKNGYAAKLDEYNTKVSIVYTKNLELAALYGSLTSTNLTDIYSSIGSPLSEETFRNIVEAEKAARRAKRELDIIEVDLLASRVEYRIGTGKGLTEERSLSDLRRAAEPRILEGTNIIDFIKFHERYRKVAERKYQDFERGLPAVVGTLTADQINEEKDKILKYINSENSIIVRAKVEACRANPSLTIAALNDQHRAISAEIAEEIDRTFGSLTPPITMEPTIVPTIEPTMAPTPTTEAPTVEPTMGPTTGPTVVPTVEPTVVPTVVPTSEPTMVPTPTTEEPTMVPTEPEPTIVPTATAEAPTLEPTSSEPTVVPTFEPTVVPTEEPTMAPTPVELDVSDGPSKTGSITLSKLRFRPDTTPEVDREETERIFENVPILRFEVYKNGIRVAILEEVKEQLNNLKVKVSLVGKTKRGELASRAMTGTTRNVPLDDTVDIAIPEGFTPEDFGLRVQASYTDGDNRTETKETMRIR